MREEAQEESQVIQYMTKNAIVDIPPSRRIGPWVETDSTLGALGSGGRSVGEASRPSMMKAGLRYEKQIVD